jgi:hypothetical protein
MPVYDCEHASTTVGRQAAKRLTLEFLNGVVFCNDEEAVFPRRYQNRWLDHGFCVVAPLATADA